MYVYNVYQKKNTFLTKQILLSERNNLLHIKKLRMLQIDALCMV